MHTVPSRTLSLTGRAPGAPHACHSSAPQSPQARFACAAQFIKTNYREAYEDFYPTGPYNYLWHDLAETVKECPPLKPQSSASVEYKQNLLEASIDSFLRTWFPNRGPRSNSGREKPGKSCSSTEDCADGQVCRRAAPFVTVAVAAAVHSPRVICYAIVLRSSQLRRCHTGRPRKVLFAESPAPTCTCASTH